MLCFFASLLLLVPDALTLFLDWLFVIQSCPSLFLIRETFVTVAWGNGGLEQGQCRVPLLTRTPSSTLWEGFFDLQG